MAPAPFSASAPGSLMLFGEHAVLRGLPAIACAVEARIRVTVHPRADRRVSIHSSLGEVETSLDDFAALKPFSFLLSAVRMALGRDDPARPGQFVFSASIPGMDIAVSSDFSSTVGLGSSAAVTVATLAALNAWTGAPTDPEDLRRRATAVIRSVQGAGSGTDATASAHGGVILFDPAADTVTPLPGRPPIHLIYSGAKDPTARVVGQVNEWEARHPEPARAVFAAVAAVTQEAAAAFRQADYARVGELMNIHQGLQEAMGVCHAPFREIIAALRANPRVLGCKISGSGLGDCAVALGDPSAEVPGYTGIPVTISSQGAIHEAC